jgi:Tfp pilus assembly protein PilF
MFQFYYGERLYISGRFHEAALQLKGAINGGFATPSTYFDLAACQSLDGRSDQATTTLVDALHAYPRSVFLRTALSSFLDKIEARESASEQYRIAFEISAKQAESWRLAHERGLEELALTSVSNTQYVSTFELLPPSAPLALDRYQKLKRVQP